MKYFSGMRAAGFSFIFGGLWTKVCSPAVAFAVVRREGPVAGTLASAAKAVTFGGFERRIMWFCVAGTALRDKSTYLIKRRKLLV